MTQEKILNYAYIGALETWHTTAEAYHKHPDEGNWERQKNAWKDLQEISAIAKKDPVQP